MDNTFKTVLISVVVAGLVALSALMVGSNEPTVGAIPGVAMYATPSLENTIEWAPATTTEYIISHAESGSTFYLSATGTTMTLPAVRDELSYKFVVAGPLDTNNVVIDSAEGDNIEGTLIVAGAVVDCAGEDQINFVTDGENVGDYVELYSDGYQWYIGDSGVLTSAKMTCTDPS